MANGVFQNYPDYNFSISGLSNPGANTFYGYAGFDGGKPFWRSLDDAFSIYYENSNWFFKALNNDFNLVSNQQNVDWPWNVTGWTLQSGELDGTPVFALVSFNKSNIVVSGLGNSGVEGIDINGTYILGYRGFGNWWQDPEGEEFGTNFQRPFYIKTNGYSSEDYDRWSYIIRWDNGFWYIYNEYVGNGFLFSSEEGDLPYYPTDVAWVSQTQVPTGMPVLTFSDTPDPYAPWGGFANWQRLRLLEYV